MSADLVIAQANTFCFVRKAAVKLASQYISDRYLPDKAIDIMDEAGSKVRQQMYKERACVTRPRHLMCSNEEFRRAVTNGELSKGAMKPPKPLESSLCVVFPTMMDYCQLIDQSVLRSIGRRARSLD